jgi:hypothetical protein
MGGPEKPSSPVEEGSKRSASRANDEDEDGQILKSQGWPETTDHSNSKHIPQTCLKTCFFLNKNFNVSCDDTYMYLEVDTFIYVPGSTLDLCPVYKCARGQFMQLATVGPFFWDAHVSWLGTLPTV